jgi:hypothetical protein
MRSLRIVEAKEAVELALEWSKPGDALPPERHLPALTRAESIPVLLSA